MLTVPIAAEAVSSGRTAKLAALSKRRTAITWRSLRKRHHLSSFILGALMLIVFGCIIFTIVQHTWSSMAILIVMEVLLVLITAGTGVIEGVLQMASESLGGFMRS